MLRSTSPLGVVALLACQPGTPPGSQVGTYQVRGTLQQNSCGPEALPVADPLDFTVEVRRQGANGLWILGGSARVATGTLDEVGNFSFLQRSEYQAIPPHKEHGQLPEPWYDWDPEPPATSDPGCVLVTEEQVVGRLDMASSAADSGTPIPLSAHNVIRIRALAGSNCLPVLAVAGGPFQELPCEASYALSGEHLESRFQP